MPCRGSEISCFVPSFPETYLESAGKAQVTIPNKVQNTKLYGAGRDTLQCYDLLTHESTYGIIPTEVTEGTCLNFCFQRVSVFYIQHYTLPDLIHVRKSSLNGQCKYISPKSNDYPPPNAEISNVIHTHHVCSVQFLSIHT